jgi:hypothetical protein
VKVRGSACGRRYDVTPSRVLAIAPLLIAAGALVNLLD